ncbi:spore coat associated protein CotJA [Sporosarcina sp. FSL K6-2383]|uniref:spore coat associated protein CotJA n=2 Tax=Sporosarcina sp. FSL K6-2383 TaxID=2921556 RepID=UPI00315A54D2
MERPMFRGSYKPYVSPLDPCPPIWVKTFVLPPQIFMNFQPPGLPQNSPEETLRQGTLWPSLADGFSREEGIS